MNSMAEQPKKQTLTLRDRHDLSLDGILNVIAFDEACVILSTVEGGMSVEGEGLHITRLDLAGGCLSLEGRVSAILYTGEEKGEKRGLFSRFTK